MISESVHEAPGRELEPLHELARSSGVLLAYRDALGVERQVGPDVLLAILRELGQPVERLADVPEALVARRRWWVSRLLPRVAVAWDGVLPALPLRLPKGDGFDARVELVLSNGEVKKLPGGAAAAPVVQVREVGGEAFTERRLGLPAPLPLGYHRLRARSGDDEASCTLIVTPAWLGLPESLWYAVAWAATATLLAEAHGYLEPRRAMAIARLLSRTPDPAHPV